MCTSAHCLNISFHSRDSQISVVLQSKMPVGLIAHVSSGMEKQIILPEVILLFICSCIECETCSNTTGSTIISQVNMRINFHVPVSQTPLKKEKINYTKYHSSHPKKVTCRVYSQKPHTEKTAENYISLLSATTLNRNGHNGERFAT